MNTPEKILFLYMETKNVAQWMQEKLCHWETAKEVIYLI